MRGSCLLLFLLLCFFLHECFFSRLFSVTVLIFQFASGMEGTLDGMYLQLQNKGHEMGLDSFVDNLTYENFLNYTATDTKSNVLGDNVLNAMQIFNAIKTFSPNSEAIRMSTMVPKCTVRKSRRHPPSP